MQQQPERAGKSFVASAGVTRNGRGPLDTLNEADIPGKKETLVVLVDNAPACFR
jgi:hypothetical protein